jgi:hypothetical protein
MPAIIVGALFFWGLWYAGREMFRAVGQSAGSARASAKSRPGRSRTQRAYARSATTGWWAKEVGQGLPTFRRGWNTGWSQHQHALIQLDHTSSATEARQAEQQQKWREAVAAHKARIAAATAPPPLPDPPQPQPAPIPVPPPPWPGPQPPAARAQNTGHPSPQPAIPPAGPTNGSNGGSPQMTGNGSATGDVQYEQAVATAVSTKAAADAAVNSTLLNNAKVLADQLAPVLGDDTQGISLASELAAEIKAVQEHAKAMLDKAEALERHLVTKHGGVHEASLAAGVLADRQFHGHG